MTFARVAPDPEPLLTSEQVAAWLQIPVKTLYEWRLRGRAPVGIRVGKYTRYRRRDVETFLDQQRTA